ncbi:MAG: glycosyltransferase family 4 protein, partial [Candidatus Sumerlaeia bacterium]|nr:glycosyltransferase family 4 protein [Candidatus Sumerlaeia bacterium]
PVADQQSKRQALGIPPGKQVISIIGRLEPQKGHRYAVEAIHKLVGKTREFVVLIVGEGSLESEIRAQINALGLNEYFKFLGLRTDIPEILGVTDILLLTSLWEGLPFTVQEAMFAGVPVVASRVDGNVEAIVDGTTGYLIDYKNADEISARLYHLLINPSQRKIMGEAGQQRARELFTLEMMIKQTEKIYDSLLK